MFALWLVQVLVLWHVHVCWVRATSVYLGPDLLDHASRLGGGDEGIVREMEGLQGRGLSDCICEDLYHLLGERTVV